TPRFPAASLEAPPMSFFKKLNMIEMSVDTMVTSCPRLPCSDVRHLALTLKEKRFLPADETSACALHWGAAKTVGRLSKAGDRKANGTADKRRWGKHSSPICVHPRSSAVSFSARQMLDQ